MQPYVTVAVTLVPELVPLIAGDQAGILEPAIVRTVIDTTRAATAAGAIRTVKADEKIASQLKARLRAIVAVAERGTAEDILQL
jgi:hypothetical protein